MAPAFGAAEVMDHQEFIAFAGLVLTLKESIQQVKDIRRG